jgi:hypothetical protein
MSLWSSMVVSVQDHGSGGGWPTVPLPARTVICIGRWSTSGPQISNPRSGLPQPTSSVSGNFHRRLCFRISAMTCYKWSARIRWRLWPSAAIVTQLVTRLLVSMLRFGDGPGREPGPPGTSVV